jgi:ATP-binding cassette, subfamily C, bacterial
MKQIFRIFLRADGASPVAVLLSLLLAALCEAVGISALLPAAALLSGNGSAPANSGMRDTINMVFDTIGFQPTLGAIILVITSAMILKSLISFGALTYAGYSASRVSVRLREKLIAALFNAEWRFYSDQHSGNFANAVSNDATRAGDAYMLAAQFASLLVQSVIYTGIAFFMDWRLALLGAVVGLFMARSLSFLIRVSKRAGSKQTDRTRSLTVGLVDMLTNIKPLKTMHRHGALQLTLQKNMQRLQRSLKTREIAKQGLAQAGDAIMAIALGTIVYLAYSTWNVGLAELLVGGVILLKVVQNVTKLQRLLQQSVQVESAYERVEELLRHSEANQEVHTGTAAPETKADCRFVDVSFAYGEKPVLSGVNLTIPARGITVLKGSSGAGKTTIIDLLIGLHKPSKGQILIGHTPLEKVDIIKLRRSIGYVPQEISLMHASIRDNITLGDTTIGDDRVRAALDLAGGAAFLAGLADGLDTDVGEMGGKLSGGQRQRISLARALVTEPEILILDEVTSALDPATEAEIVANIANLSRRYTIIIITHREAWAEIADRLYEVSQGKVEEVTPHTVAVSDAEVTS